MQSGSKKVIYAAFIANVILAIGKFITAAFTGSSAMLSEGIHTTVDTGNQLMLLLGIRRAKKSPDKQHPFGYGQELYFWSFVVSIMIFALGAGISIYEGIHNLMDPHPIEDVWVTYAVLVAGIFIEGTAWTITLREFNKTKGDKGYFEAVHREKNPSTFVILFEDSAAILGLLVAIGGIALTQFTGILYFDGIAFILIGLILGGTASWLAFETKELLIGESADRDIVAGIRTKTAQALGEQNIKEVLTLHMGPQYILVTINAHFNRRLDAPGIEQQVQSLTKEIKACYPSVKRVFIEAESISET